MDDERVAADECGLDWQLAALTVAPDPLARADAVALRPVPAPLARRRVVIETIAHAAACGLTLPIVVVRFATIPRDQPDGCAVYIVRELTRIFLRDTVDDARLPHLLLHELQHASDYLSGFFRTSSRLELERRAILFSWRALRAMERAW